MPYLKLLGPDMLQILWAGERGGCSLKRSDGVYKEHIACNIPN